MKQQVWYIGGGDSFDSQEAFLQQLRTVDLWHMDPSAESTSWTSTMEEALGPNYEFIRIPMPNKQDADFEAWSIWFERHFTHMAEQPILIGLSLGAMFLAKYLAFNDVPFSPKALFLLAGAYEIPNESLEGTGSFLVSPQTVSSVASKYKTIIMHSKDDFVVPFSHGKALAAALPEAEFVVYEDKNHFLIEEFPEIVSKIKSF